MRTSNRKRAVLFTVEVKNTLSFYFMFFLLKIYISYLFISAEITNVHTKENTVALSLAELKQT